MSIVVTRRSDDYHACLENDPRIWGCGESVTEAIGDLISSNQALFNINVRTAH